MFNAGKGRKGRKGPKPLSNAAKQCQIDAEIQRVAALEQEEPAPVPGREEVASSVADLVFRDMEPILMARSPNEPQGVDTVDDIFACLAVTSHEIFVSDSPVKGMDNAEFSKLVDGLLERIAAKKGGEF